MTSHTMPREPETNHSFTTETDFTQQILQRTEMAENKSPAETGIIIEPMNMAWFEEQNNLFTEKYSPIKSPHNIYSFCRIHCETPHSEVGDVHREPQSQATSVQRRHGPQHDGREDQSLVEQLRHTELALQQVIDRRMSAENERTAERKRLCEVEIEMKEEQRLSDQQTQELQRLRTHMRNIKLSTTALPLELLDKSSYKDKTKEELIKDLMALQSVYAAKINEAQAKRLQADFHKKELEEVKLQLQERESKDLKVAENLKAEKAALQMEAEAEADAPEKVQQTSEEVHDSADEVMETAGKMGDTPRQPSLWRQCKKFVTPKCCRKYKQRQEEDQDQ